MEVQQRTPRSRAALPDDACRFNKGPESLGACPLFEAVKVSMADSRGRSLGDLITCRDLEAAENVVDEAAHFYARCKLGTEEERAKLKSNRAFAAAPVGWPVKTLQSFGRDPSLR